MKIKKSRAEAGLETEMRNLITQSLIEGSTLTAELLFQKYNTSFTGLKADDVETNRDAYGVNKITKEKKKSLARRLMEAFINPFSLILFILAGVSLVTDVLMAAVGEKNIVTVLIIVVMVLISGLVRFIQETRSNKAAEKISDMVETTTSVERDGVTEEIPLDEVVAGDIIHLAAGDIIPADIRILKSKDLFTSQSSLTGESEPVEKDPSLPDKKYDMMTERPNLAFMGSTIISGSATGLVIVVGDDTMFGQIAKTQTEKVEKTSFEKGVNSVSWILIRFMLIMVPLVFFLNGLTKGNWMNAFLFGISVAVGLTPEMLPMIMTTCLAKGAVSMSKKDTIIKNLNSIQNFGAIDVLCTDKTGTLTQDKVVLERHLDIHGMEDPRILKHAFLNSYFQTGLKNLMDLSIIEKTHEFSATLDFLKDLSTQYTKVDEVPFDFSRRMMSVVVSDKNGKTQMITKGAVEEILSICDFVEYRGKIQPITDELKREVFRTVDALNDEGMRVIAVSQKNEVSPVGVFSVKDETHMVLMGYLAFLDPPKSTTKDAILALRNHGVEVKVLTGDGDRVTRAICKQVGLTVKNLLLGSDVEKMSDEELAKAVETSNVFAKLAPALKGRVVRTLRNNGHVVGYMGDGINDVSAMKAADVGISVDTAVDIAKESAHVILLKKDLMVLDQGIIEGRRTFANMIKYIKITASSNFGNMLSVLLASAFLPFLPMLPVHIIFLNLIYDLSCSVIPWDNVDEESIRLPKKWDASSIGKFMVWIGPTSSVFDLTTYFLMYLIICPQMFGGRYETLDPAKQLQFMMLFQTGWFVESMLSQSIVIHMFRTEKLPFIQSRASVPVMFMTLFAVSILTVIPFTAFGTSLGLMPLPGIYFLWLTGTIVLYMLLAQVLKHFYIKKYGKLL